MSEPMPLAMTKACQYAIGQCKNWLELRSILDSVEILPNPEPAPAEAAFVCTTQDVLSYGAPEYFPAEAAQPNPAASEAEALERMFTHICNSGVGYSAATEDAATIRLALRRLAELEKTQPTQEQVREAWKGLRHYAEDSLEGKLEAILDPAYKDVGCCDTSIRAIAAALPKEEV